MAIGERHPPGTGDGLGETTAQFAGWDPYASTLLLLRILYRVRRHGQITWSGVLPGAPLTSVVRDVAGHHGFAFYAAEFAFYSLGYGSVPACDRPNVVVLL